MSHNSESVTFLEKRKFARAYFSSSDDVTGTIVIPGRITSPGRDNISPPAIGGNPRESGLSGNITDLSIGGLYLVLKRGAAQQMKVGDILTLKEVRATILYNLELNIDMRIRRIHNYEFVAHVGWGCEFVEISAEDRAVIRQLVDWGLQANRDRG
jgi:c-di-GMP-binding flagellar brake protein YcgR